VVRLGASGPQPTGACRWTGTATVEAADSGTGWRALYDYDPGLRLVRKLWTQAGSLRLGPIFALAPSSPLAVLMIIALAV
jgi:hypothetical protein